ncbi:MAG TPA: hypothetical protein VFM90_09825, partial [Cyclobacteriaceae bacterium]|nr:hypothetical protein [Cyclobacteriaceae bacterium]
MKKYILAFSVSLITLGAVHELSAQNRFWIAGSASNWNNPLNWSATSGGPGGASVPVTGNTAVFDGGGAGTCILDVAPNLNAITVSASFSGNIELPANRTITTTGSINFAGGTITSGTGATLTLDVSGTTTFSGTQFDAPLGGVSNRILFNGSVFNGVVDITKSENNTDTGTGGNTFNNAVTLRHGGTGEFRLGETNPDIFNGTLNLVINNTGSIRPARTSAGNQFNGNVVISYNSTGDVLFGVNGGSSILADTYTISANCAGTGCDDLTLSNFTQIG